MFPWQDEVQPSAAVSGREKSNILDVMRVGNMLDMNTRDLTICAPWCSRRSEKVCVDSAGDESV